MSSLVDHVRSNLTDPTPQWESVSPEAKTIIRLCLSCRSASRILDKLQVLGTLNQCISASMLRGQWNNQVDDYIHKNIQHPTGWIKLLTSKGTKLTDNEAISELVDFYRNTWNKFQRWEKDQTPDSKDSGSAETEKPAPPLTDPALCLTAQPPSTDNSAAVIACLQKSQKPVKGFSPATLHEGDLYPGSPSLPWSTPRYTEYRGLEYFLYGGPPDPQSREYQFWYVTFTDKRPVQSAEAFSSPVTANFEARDAIDVLLGQPIPEPASTTALKRGSKRKRNS